MQFATPARSVRVYILISVSARSAMSDLRQLGKEFLYDFIELYKRYPCLWHVKSKEYSNRVLKDKAYQVLIDKYKEVDRKADRDMIVRKINSIRSVYRKELKKIDASIQAGAKGDEVYKPNLWYFKQLQFLREYTVDGDAAADNQTHDNGDRSMSPVASPVTSVSETAEPENNIIHSVREREPPTVSVSSQYRPTFKRKSEDCIEDVLQLIGKRLSSSRPDDHLDYAAKNWIATLRSVPKEQQIFAVRVIGDVMCEAQLGTLNRNSRLALCEHKEPHFQCPQQYSTESSEQSFNTFSIKQLPMTPSMSGSSDLTSLHIQDGL